MPEALGDRAQLGRLHGAAADVDGAQEGDHGAHALTLTPGTHVVCGKGSSQVTERRHRGNNPFLPWDVPHPPARRSTP